jgi:hypothetical protein
MRSQVGSLVLAGLIGIVASPLCAATPDTVDQTRVDATTPPVAVQHVSIPATGLREEAAMVLVGTALIGLAAAVRRAS